MGSNQRSTTTELDIESVVPASIDIDATARVVNGVELNVVTAGDEDDPLVVLLYGFPEFWYGWREQIAPLVGAGYQVLVPDQRGYNLSEKPQGVRAYRTRELAGDVRALIRSEGKAAAHVVGHDWGGMVAWELALRYPEVIDRLGIVNAPHPTAYRRQLRSNPEQLRRSWYAIGFQLPWLPEFACRYDDYRLLERALRRTARPGTFGDDEVAAYRRAWDRDGALTGMLNWYRAATRYPSTPPREQVDAPTLVVWGEDDDALVPALAVDSAGFCSDSRLELFPAASHWVLHEEPDRVTALLRSHLGS
ncbi:alpha/beta fold hydrolase [Natrinema longum]|uniref:Alpha/beta hydrolase n=1 Tax=Natrinema longum TaxID=370324 RepID=A0A8A2U9S9_9EURY|nr:alpha/beta hydrolase [Natrinema longum]MBZ6493309.1 alpha/beta hydrolase [Natrinema longum]QSW85343.1 alpha/beta hydrolase [Natrinema longum]